MTRLLVAQASGASARAAYATVFAPDDYL